MIERFDFIFSYWIFVWYLFYEFDLVQYNPKIAIIIGIIVNLFEVGLMMYYFKSYILILVFVITIILTKGLPLWTLRKDSLKWRDFYAFVILFLIYILWLLVNQIDIKKEITDIYQRTKENKPIGPFMYYIERYLLNK